MMLSTPCLSIRRCALPAILAAFAVTPAHADNSEDIFKNALNYTVQIKTAVPVPFDNDKKGSGRGAGFVVDTERGWIMTNAHVVSRSPARVEVAFYGQDFAEANKVYVDPFLDLAIVSVGERARKNGVQAPELECGELPNVGHPVGAFGHPWGLPFTGTRGILSGVTSKYETELLQTDAPINQGNSGGPLISLREGRIIGINTASIVERGAQNTNFAVAMKYACRVLRLLQGGADPSPPKLPVVFFKDLDERKVLRVARSYLGPGEIRLETGDIIQGVVGVNGAIQNETQLVHALRGRLQDAGLVVLRGGKEITVKGVIHAETPVTQRKGLLVSGILFGSLDMRDIKEVKLGKLMVHYVERGSVGEFNDIEKNDILESVDGRSVQSLEELMALLSDAQRSGASVIFTLRRLSGGDALFTYLERTMKASHLGWIGGNPQ